jgi:hypothetical protein
VPSYSCKLILQAISPLIRLCCRAAHGGGPWDNARADARGRRMWHVDQVPATGERASFGTTTSFFGLTGGRQWLWCSEDGASSLAWLGVEEMEKMRADGFGSFSQVERFNILEEYSLFWNLFALYCFNQTLGKVEWSRSIPLNS